MNYRLTKEEGNDIEVKKDNITYAVQEQNLRLGRCKQPKSWLYQNPSSLNIQDLGIKNIEKT